MNDLTASTDEAAIALLRRMVEIRSLSGNEGEVARFLAEQASRMGLRAAVDDAGNFVAATAGDPSRSTSEHRDIVLLGHMDTVPGEVPVRIEGDKLYGRGSVDAKGPLATFLIAAAAVRDALPEGVRLVVIGAVEEETPTSRGARAVAGRYRPGACVIGEPSGWDGVTIGYKGRLVVRYELVRPGGHSAGPHGSVADAAMAWWSSAREAALSLAPRDGGAFGQVQATLRHVSTSTDGLMDRVEVTAGFRLPPGVSPDAVRLACLGPATEGASIAFEGDESAVVADRQSALVRSLTMGIRGVGARPRLVYKTGTSDMNVVGPAWKCPIAAYGPGDSALDHTPDEHIVLSEYVAAIGVLKGALTALAGEWGKDPVLATAAEGRSAAGRVSG